MPEPLRTRIAEAIEADGVLPREQRVGLIDAMLAVVQPELDQLHRDCQSYADLASGAERARQFHKDDADRYEHQLRQERDRYRSAWQSARQRAEAYGEGILRHIEARDNWKSWMHEQAARAEKAETALAEYESVRASVTAGEPLGRALTVSEVMEQHDVTRKALIHELGDGLHLNWRQVIAAVGRLRRAAFDWRKDFEQAQAERDAARAAVSRVTALAADMRTWCSPHGLADHYADQLDQALAGAESNPVPPYDLPAGFRAGAGGEQ